MRARRRGTIHDPGVLPTLRLSSLVAERFGPSTDFLPDCLAVIRPADQADKSTTPRRPGSYFRETPGRFARSVRRESDAPRQFADLDRLDDFLFCDVDHGNIVGNAVRDDQIFFVRREIAVPDALSNEQVFYDLVGRAIDDGDPIGGPQIDEPPLAVLGEIDADRLDFFGPQSGNLEPHGRLDLPRRGIDDRQLSADLRGHPKLRSVRLIGGKSGTRTQQHVGDDLVALGVDEMRHARRLRRAYQHARVGADRHSLGLDSYGNLAQRQPFVDVDDRHHRVVFIGDVQPLPGGIERELLGVRTRWQLPDVLIGLRVEDLDGVVVAERHEYRFSVPGNRYSARALSGRNRRDGFHLVGVDDGDGIALFVRNEGEKGRSGIGLEQQ